MKAPRVFVAGDLNVDLHFLVKGMPRPEEESHADFISITIGGNAANFAVALGKLGMPPEFYSCVGDDLFRGFLLRELRSAGVRTRLRGLDMQNGCTGALVLRDGCRSFVSNKGASGMLTASDLKPILNKARKGDIFYVGGIFHLPRLAKGLGGFLPKAREAGMRVLLDFTHGERGLLREFRGIAGMIDISFLNEQELSWFGKGMSEPLERLSGMGIPEVVVKLGCEGAAHWYRGRLSKEKGFKVKALDTTGAGDVFNAGYVYGMCLGLGPEGCLRLGNMLASYKVSRIGIAVPPRERVSSFLRSLK